MLQQLEITNIALIDKVSVELGGGLNILTGETGAGKSIIIDSINAVLGGRASKDLIRTGKDKASVQAVFSIDDGKVGDFLQHMGIEHDEEDSLIITREFSLSGKNICRINGSIVNVSTLKELGELLIDVHGQHDNQSLLRTESHVELLDLFAGEEVQALKCEYGTLLQNYKELKNKLRELSGDRKDRERKIDLLNYQIDEIKKAGLKAVEEEELNRQRLLISNSGKILKALSHAHQALVSDSDEAGAALDCINIGVSELHSIERVDDKYKSLSRRLEDLSYMIEDIAKDIRDERDRVDFDPALMDEVSERLDLIFRLKKKYGNSIKEILQYCESIENELNMINNSEELLEQILSEMDKTAQKLFCIAQKISDLRKKAAELLESKIGRELDELEMKRAQFKVQIDFEGSSDRNDEKRFLANGLDKVEFLISPNAGEPLKSLAKIASGGEMSRVMLAIKNILADVDKVPTLIFDEIDTGISGIAAQKVGEKLTCISESHQVICVTHLAQIACMADCHYLIEKISHNDSTFTNVVKLEGKEINNEIARILGGANISPITLKHAGEMLKYAKKFKKEWINT